MKPQEIRDQVMTFKTDKSTKDHILGVAAEMNKQPSTAIHVICERDRKRRKRKSNARI